jgi:hypothetical protein
LGPCSKGSHKARASLVLRCSARISQARALARASDLVGTKGHKRLTISTIKWTGIRHNTHRNMLIKQVGRKRRHCSLPRGFRRLMAGSTTTKCSNQPRRARPSSVQRIMEREVLSQVYLHCHCPLNNEKRRLGFENPSGSAKLQALGKPIDSWFSLNFIILGCVIRKTAASCVCIRTGMIQLTNCQS